VWYREKVHNGAGRTTDMEVGDHKEMAREVNRGAEGYFRWGDIYFYTV
jgi:hypothetical protein